MLVSMYYSLNLSKDVLKIYFELIKLKRSFLIRTFNNKPKRLQKRYDSKI